MNFVIVQSSAFCPYFLYAYENGKANWHSLRSIAKTFSSRKAAEKVVKTLPVGPLPITIESL